MSENHSINHYKTWWLYLSLRAYYLIFGGILYESFFAKFSLKISDVFFSRSNTIGHISGMVCPIDVKRKGDASIGYWINSVTLTFDLTHDLDL